MLGRTVDDGETERKSSAQHFTGLMRLWHRQRREYWPRRPAASARHRFQAATMRRTRGLPQPLGPIDGDELGPASMTDRTLRGATKSPKFLAMREARDACGRAAGQCRKPAVLGIQTPATNRRVRGRDARGARPQPLLVLTVVDRDPGLPAASPQARGRYMSISVSTRLCPGAWGRALAHQALAAPPFQKIRDLMWRARLEALGVDQRD